MFSEEVIRKCFDVRRAEVRKHHCSAAHHERSLGNRDNALAKSERRAREKADCVDVALGRHGDVGYLTNLDTIRDKDGRAYQWRACRLSLCLSIGGYRAHDNCD